MNRIPNKTLIFSGARYAAILAIAMVFVGGVFDWIFLNQQEYQISLIDAQIDYLSSYVSAFVIAAIEVAGAYYFIQKYDLGSKKDFVKPAAILGVIGFVAYMIGELAAGASSLGSSQIALGDFLYLELSPSTLDYGNALVIFISLFALMLLLKVLLSVNPMPKRTSGLSNSTGYFGGLWTAIVTTASAMVCCGPLPGAIALATGISSLYFTKLINLQSLIVLISVPLILFALVLAEKRAKQGCRLRS